MAETPAVASATGLCRPPGELVDQVDNDWAPLLQAWRRTPAGQALLDAVGARVRAGATVFPADVFRALRCTPLSAVRVLILGQDPYHGPGQAEGLAFSVAEGQRPPPSLRNIFKELQRDLGLPPPATGSLLPWAQRGVLLLNASLSVEQGRPGSHSKLGWQVLTDEIVAAAAEDSAPKVFMLWGAHAQRKAGLIAEAAGPDGRHLLLQCNHPSPLSALRGPAPFIGSGVFGRAKNWLDGQPAATPFDWGLHGASVGGGGKRNRPLKVV